MIKTSTLEAPCEHCGKRTQLQLLEYVDINILMWLCKDCYEVIEKRQDRLKKRIRNLFLHPNKRKDK